jgi:glutamine synthetase
MAKLKLEFIWLDGYTPLANLRSKTKLIDGDPAALKFADLPIWG